MLNVKSMYVSWDIKRNPKARINIYVPTKFKRERYVRRIFSICKFFPHIICNAMKNSKNRYYEKFKLYLHDKCTENKNIKF